MLGKMKEVFTTLNIIVLCIHYKNFAFEFSFESPVSLSIDKFLQAFRENNTRILNKFIFLLSFSIQLYDTKVRCS